MILWIFIVFNIVYYCDSLQLPYPNINSLLILNNTITNNTRNILIEFNGENLISDNFHIKLTLNDSQCLFDNNFKLIRTKKSYNQFLVTLPSDLNTNIYFCLNNFNDLVNLSENSKWNHIGNNIFLNLQSNTQNDTIHQFNYPESRNPKSVRRKKRRTSDDSIGSTHNDLEDPILPPLKIRGVRVEKSDKEPDVDEEGVPLILSGTSCTIRLFGDGFTNNMAITLTTEKNDYGGPCQLPATEIFHAEEIDKKHGTALLQIKLPTNVEKNAPLYFCAKVNEPEFMKVKVDQIKPFVHQGHDPWLQLKTFKKFIPLWASIIVIICCLSFSALFSGLNLGLMSLDRTELKILCNTGNESERKHARTIQPVRDHGNYLLCSILLGNVLVNSIFTILLDDLTSGFIAVIFSTLAIVMFGEISPQAICSRYGLAVGAKTIYITKAVMLITAPLSYPISKILDFILGEEIGAVYNRERLKELIKVTTDINDLDKEEVNIVTGALELRKKFVSNIMTKIEDVYMLDIEAILDFETVSEIMKTGFSRIPVYEGTRQNIVTVLYIKDLAFVDPDDNTPLKTLCQFYQNPCNFVFEDCTLDVIFKEFKEGNKGHMAFVHRVNSEGEGDPFYEVIGLVTLEDVIEELIQAEIMDETDVFTDNRSKRRRNADRAKQDFSVFAERRENQRIHISPQLTLATYQYLSASVDLFKPEIISETTLKRMLKQDIFLHIKKNKDKKDQNVYIYTQGKPVDFFVLILEGRVEVTVGRENLVFEGGPFTYFGLQALMQNVSVDSRRASKTSEFITSSWLQHQRKNSVDMVNLSRSQTTRRPSSSRPPSQVFNTDLAVADVNIKNVGRQKAPTPSTGVSPSEQVESPVVPTNMGSLQSLNMDAMIKYTFLPDYSVRAVTDVLYMKVRRSLYLAAKRATLMERSTKDSTTNEQFDAEMEKVVNLVTPELERNASPFRYSETDISEHNKKNETDPTSSNSMHDLSTLNNTNEPSTSKKSSKTKKIGKKSSKNEDTQSNTSEVSEEITDLLKQVAFSDENVKHNRK